MNYSKKNLNNVNNDKVLVKARSVLQVSVTEMNPNTGEVISDHSYSGTKKQSKKGWLKMYAKTTQEIMLNLTSFPVANKIWILLMTEFKQDGTIKPFKKKDLAAMVKTDPSTVSRAFKKLEELEAIVLIGLEYRYNPFAITVSGQSDEQLHEAQQLWEEEVGHYGQELDTVAGRAEAAKIAKRLRAKEAKRAIARNNKEK